ncbi:acyl-CoA synthetase [Candidatus Acidianus copahuensis]|uniref:Acyl-CoA synthetase n=1 Tax=Candidatus Acidianus copahuensis TaxID=1160895 RepID=A0A031LWK1_9CREN|nr:fatty acid--CoA ligase family protein [Candidatus Acidianus copahuensis]EZQ11523.1 acyl-CoA synthetase [Candidatus Acidianus copahuensis]
MDKFNVPLLQTYGMTEALSVTSQPIELKHVLGTVGIPEVDVDVKVVDPDNPEKELGVNETGELLVKSPWIMKGYSDEGENTKVFLNGWLRTGDLLMMNDDGLFFFKGVKKRLIKYKGYPIFPRDLELILLKHPAVKEVFVTAEKDPSVGEIPVAYVVPRDNVSEDEPIKFVNSKVAFYKKLRKIYLVKEIPK